jgi:hypothetical protein
MPLVGKSRFKRAAIPKDKPEQAKENIPALTCDRVIDIIMSKTDE